MGDIMLELYGDDIVGEEEHFDDFDDETYNKIIASYQKRRGLSLTNRQKQAVRKCLVHRFHTVCGYPGTGKTTITEAACTYLKQQNPDMNICLTSHTGLATKNLKKAIDKQLYKEKLVATITKLIYSTFPRIIQDQKTKEYGDEDAEYADCAPDLIIVDEISMVDMQLFYELLQWCKKFNCRLILLGDEKQLPPIGPGNTLQTFVDAFNDVDDELFKASFPISYLKDIKRQSVGVLKDNIMAMNTKTVRLSNFDNESMIFLPETDFIDTRTKKMNRQKLIKFLEKYDLTSENTHFLSPQKSKETGYLTINNMLQKHFNPTRNTNPEDSVAEIVNNKKSKFSPDYVFHERDKVMRLKNDYNSEQKTFFANGDIGTVYLVNDDHGNEKVCIQYDDKQKQILNIFELYEDFIPFYCNTIHKSQGSQYDNIVCFVS